MGESEEKEIECVTAVEDRLWLKKEEVVKIANSPIKIRTEKFPLNSGRSLLSLQGGILVCHWTQKSSC